MKKRIILGLCGLLSLSLLVGCQVIKNVTKKKISYADIVKDGTINVELAREAGYVSLAEKDQLGYSTIEVNKNKKVQKQALEQQAEIYEKIQPVIEEHVQRKVKLTGIQSPFPYPTINVNFITTEEPILASTVSIGLEDSSYFLKDGLLYQDGREEYGSGWQRNTIGSLYGYVYQDQLEEIKQKIEADYPEYTAGFCETGDLLGSRLKMFFIYPQGDIGGENQKNHKDTVDTLYQLYKENPNRTKEEWKTLFAEHPLKYTLSIRAMLKEESTLPTAKMVEELATTIDQYPETSLFAKLNVIIRTQLQATDENGPLHSEQYKLERGEANE